MFLHTYHPQPIILKIGVISIHWYGLLITVGIVLGLILVNRLAKNYNLKKDEIFDLAFYLVIFGLIGARLWSVLTETSGYYWQNPWAIFKIWQGGLAIHGAITVGILVLFFYSRRKGNNLFLWLDLIVLALILGQAFGRWGNYFNQEIFGRPTNLLWGIPINLENRPVGYENFEYFHPTFLYESFWNFLIFIFLLILHLRQIKKGIISDGKIFSFYLIFYGFGRFFLEFLRVDYQSIVLGLRFEQMVALVLFFVGWIILIYRLKVVKHNAGLFAKLNN